MLTQLVAPAIEPVSLDEARTFCRAYADLGSAEDTLVSTLITAARQDAEVVLNRSLITQQWQLVLDAFPGPSLMGIPYGTPYSIPPHAITLERGTVQSIQSIQYLSAGVWTTMDPANYVADLSGNPARVTPVFGQIWPVISTPQIGNVKIAYTAGFGDTAAQVPAAIKRWISIRVATIYNNREEVALMNRGKMEVLPYIDGLLDPWKVVRY